MLSERRARRICERVLSFARSREQVEVILHAADSALTRFANNRIHQNVASQSVSLSIRVQTGRRAGRATTNRLEPEAIERAVALAREAARVQPPNEELLPLPRPARYTPTQAWHRSTCEFGPAKRVEAVASVVEVCSAKKAEAAGAFSQSNAAMAIANTKGLFAYHRSTSTTLSVTAMASDDGSGWAAAHAYEVAEIDPVALATRALQKALDSRRPQALPPGKYTVVFEPAAVADFLLFLGWLAFGAQSYLEGTSCLCGRLGKRVFGENVTIVDDAYDPIAPGLPFDYEGVPRQRVVLVDRGIAKALVHDRYTARRARARTTGHSPPQPSPSGPVPQNLVMAPGDSSLDEMIATTKRGLLVTHLHYTNAIHPKRVVLTGMTRDGTFMIENGRVTYPVRNLRFTESVIDVFNRIEQISTDRVRAKAFFGGAFVVPAIKVRDFSFTSATEF